MMHSSNEAIVDTLSGKLEGQFENGLYVFKGIPYAEPPVGKLRWMPPEPHRPWKGVRSAQKFGATSLQEVRQVSDIHVDEQVSQEPQSEDCLFLNIWTPGLDNAKRPVLFWIHGGGFIMGAGSMHQYWGNVLAKRGDIVVITVNYRLGVLVL